jgi:uncharacterized protein YecT (DUF1311 family)
MAVNAIQRGIFFFLLILLSSDGNGEAQHMNARDASCQTGPEAEQTQCFVADAQVADRELNLLYHKIRKVLSPTEQNKLQKAQHLWVEFRDANGDAERELYEGGSAAPRVHAACLAADTRQRVTELNLMYEWRLGK